MSRLSHLAFACLAAALLPGLAHAAAADARWGLYAQLAAGGTWAHKLSSGAEAVARYTWVRPNEELRAEHRLQGGQSVTVETITPGAEPGTLTVMTKEDEAAPTRSVVRLNADGTAVETFVASSGVNGRATYRMPDADHYEALTEGQIEGEWREVYASVATRVGE
ncbi:MAG: hypothetical protein B7Y99_00490 [Caulobacterales bacterium 32-69-10]|nr:MAG: hypothetical protein B7Y99_00490 [Caulobacterales bacterium 32-69-10]